MVMGLMWMREGIEQGEAQERDRVRARSGGGARTSPTPVSGLVHGDGWSARSKEHPWRLCSKNEGGRDVRRGNGGEEENRGAVVAWWWCCCLAWR